jgi:hypothetical protein
MARSSQQRQSHDPRGPGPRSGSAVLSVVRACQVKHQHAGVFEAMSAITS